MNEHRLFSMYGEKPTPPRMPHRYVRNKAMHEVVRCNAFAPATRRYDVETVDGQTMTLEQTQIATNVTEAEELNFMAANPESN